MTIVAESTENSILLSATVSATCLATFFGLCKVCCSWQCFVPDKLHDELHSVTAPEN